MQLATPFFQNATQVIATADRAEQQRRETLIPQAVHTNLSGYIRKAWDDAYLFKVPYQTRMLSCAKMRKGEYDAKQLSLIKQQGGSELYANAANIKCRTAAASIMDIYRAVNDKPYSIRPTPVPDIPADLQFEIVNRVATEIRESQVFPTETAAQDAMTAELERRASEDVRRAIDEEAQERSRKMERRIDDILTEGGWINALAQVVDDLVTYPAGILKGPIVRRKRRKTWAQDELGNWSCQVQEKLVYEFDRVSPFDFYPARNAKDVDDGYMIERLRLTRRKLTEMKNIPGYSNTEIDAVLNEGINSGWLWTADSEADEAEERESPVQSPDAKIDALEFWGEVKGQWLLDWGMSRDKVKDPNAEYQITAILVGTHVIRAVMNPHSLGAKPYFVCSWEKTNGAFWGQGIPEIVGWLIEALNSVTRNLINNIGMASGPQVAVDKGLMKPGTDASKIWPWKVWETDSTEGMGMSGRSYTKPPIDFFQPQPMVESLQNVMQTFMQLIDEYTGIPSYTHGVAAQQGAGATASGLSMLMTAAGKVIKNITAKIDSEIVGPSVERVFDQLMQYDPDNSIKGDAQIVARGSSALIAKEQQLIRMLEILDRTRNDIDMQIIGLPGRADLLKNVFRRFELDIEHNIPDKVELERRQQALMQAIQMKRTGNLDQPSPQNLDVSGAPSGGTDNSLFMPQPEQRNAA